MASTTSAGATRREDLTFVASAGLRLRAGSWATATLAAIQRLKTGGSHHLPRRGGVLFDKDKSTERIDGIVALIMAMGRAMVAQDEPQPEYSMFFV